MYNLFFEGVKCFRIWKDEMLNLIISFNFDPFFPDLAVYGLDFGHFFHKKMGFWDREKFFVDFFFIAETVHGFDLLKIIKFNKTDA